MIHVDDPSLSITIGVNTRPAAAARENLTARLVKSRLDTELVGNVSLRVLPTERPDAWEVRGRGELQLAVLVETMRREGFELTVGKPEVVTREDRRPALRADGACGDRRARRISRGHDPAPASRKGQLESMVNHGSGWVRLEYLVPARGVSSGSAPSSSPRRRGPGCCTTSSTATSPGSASCARAGAAASSPTGPVPRPPTRS